MTFYLLNHFSTGQLILLVVGVPALAAVLCVLAVDRLAPSLRHVELDDSVREVVGLMFGLLLALVIAGIVTKQDDAESAVAAEGTALAQLTRATRTFPIRVQIDFEKAIGQYVHAAVEDEWPAMRAGARSAKAAAGLESIYATIQRYEPVGEPDISVYRQALVQLDAVAANRRERLELSSQSLPSLLRVLLVFGAISFVVLSYPGTVARLRNRMVISGVITAFVCFAYLLTIVLDYPFSGDISVGYAPLQRGDLAIYWAAPRPRPVAAADVEPIAARDVVGYWTSDAFGPVVFRTVDGEVRGALRLGGGTVVAHVERGVLRGIWCEQPTRRPPDDLGVVEWRMTKSSGRDLLVGRWRYGFTGTWRGGWDLMRIAGSRFEPPDIVATFAHPRRFCHPSARGARARP